MHPPATIDLDQAAATPLHPDVAAAIAAAQAVGHANPSSHHALGRAARNLLEDARERIIAALGGRGTGVGRDRFVFTSGASEANHLAIRGMAAAAGGTGDLFFSRRDHASSVNAVAAAAGSGWRRHESDIDKVAGTAAAALATLTAAPPPAGPAGPLSGPRIVSLTLVCGQTGSQENPQAIRDLVGDRVGDRVGGAGLRGVRPPVLAHLDATQAAGLVAIDFQFLAVATLALAPHKFGGPRGIGGLLIRGDVAIEPVQAGPQEQGLRGGTEAVPLAVGFARALELAAADRQRAAREVAGLRDRLEARLLAVANRAGIPAVVVAAGGLRCPHITTIAFPGLDRQALAMASDLAGVCLATGTACASGSSEPAPALVAMGLAPEVIRGAVRLSVGRTTTAAEVDTAVERLVPIFASCTRAR